MKWIGKPFVMPLVLSLVLSLNAGCQTTQTVQQRNREMIHMQENMRQIGEENRRLAGRVEALELEMQRLVYDSDRLRTSVDDTLRTGSRDLETRLADLERQTTLLAQQREKDKQDVVDTLSQKIAKLMQETGASRAPAGQKKSARSEYGYEHVVKPGETLSEIATAYGVSVTVIIRENALKDPNRLQAGQKLFIPE
ncbi:MAG: LysM peptidoglycan-binding domain-containing protein [Kiritimatiellae bacterium]|nr:LysM peptidoglycan-binding domain-containing protein [Kiritimatiellia bacterium]